MTHAIDLVIFDCDGVLVDSEMIASRILADLLTANGYPCTEKESRDTFTGWSLASMVRHVEKGLGRPLPADFLDILAARDKEVFETDLKPIPGIADALARLDKAKCVASSSGPYRIRHSLQICNILDFFEPHIFSAEEVKNGKPAPDLFLHAATQMNAAPDNCVVVEDSIAGVQGAVAAGMRVLGFTGGEHCEPGHGDVLKGHGARAIMTHMDDLSQALESL